MKTFMIGKSDAVPRRAERMSSRRNVFAQKTSVL
jgi:hypothetical protein